MQEAVMQHSTPVSRRAAFLGAVAASVAPSVCRAGGAHPDSALIALGREHQAFLVHQRRAAVTGAEWDRYFQVVEMVEAMDARTPDGLAVKLRLLWARFAVGADEQMTGPDEDTDDAGRALWGIVRNAEALASPAGRVA